MIEFENREPTYPGRIRLAEVSGQTGVYDMTRQDEPTVVGTPVDKTLFDSIQADLNRIAPPIESTASNIATSTNVAVYPSLSAAGLLTGSTTTTSFIGGSLPANSAILCECGSGTLTDLPDTYGTLFLQKGSSSLRDVSGWFFASTGTVYRYVYSSLQTAVRGWEAMATASDILPQLTNINFASWTSGKLYETASVAGEERTIQFNIAFNSAGLPVSFTNNADRTQVITVTW